MRVVSQLTEDLLASLEGLCSMELVSVVASWLVLLLVGSVTLVWGFG